MCERRSKGGLGVCEGVWVWVVLCVCVGSIGFSCWFVCVFVCVGWRESVLIGSMEVT